MNIVFVSSEFPLTEKEATGGIGTYLLNLTRGLIKKRNLVTVITRCNKPFYNRKRFKRLKIICCSGELPITKILKRIFPNGLLSRLIIFIENTFVFSYQASLAIKKSDNKKTVDIIEGNDFGGELFFYLLLNKRHKPVVLRLHTPFYLIQKYNREPFNLFYRILKSVEVFCLKRADALYSPSKSLSGIIGRDLKIKNISVIPYPFEPFRTIGKTRRSPDTILFAGKLQVKKGILDLVSAMPLVIKKFPKARLIIVGPDTSYRGKSVKKMIVEYCRANGILKNVHLFGKELDKADLYKLYQTALITVVPSLWENFPFVCLEAMSQGSVVIGSNVGGIKEIIRRESGIVVNTKDKKILSNTVIRVLKDKELTKRLAVGARQQVAKEYDIPRIIIQTVGYYKDVIRLYRVKDKI